MCAPPRCILALARSRAPSGAGVTSLAPSHSPSHPLLTSPCHDSLVVHAEPRIPEGEVEEGKEEKKKIALDTVEIKPQKCCLLQCVQHLQMDKEESLFIY